MLSCLHLFPERDHLVSKGSKMLSEVVSKQASSEITLFERYTLIRQWRVPLIIMYIIVLFFSLAVWPSLLKIHSHFLFLDWFSFSWRSKPFQWMLGNLFSAVSSLWCRYVLYYTYNSDVASSNTHFLPLSPSPQLIADKEEPSGSINQTVLLSRIFSLCHSVALFFSSPFPQTQQATEWEEFFQPALQDCILPYFMKTVGK